MVKLLGSLLLLVGMGSVAFGQVPSASEISPASAVTAVCLVSGVVIVFRGRRKK